MIYISRLLSVISLIFFILCISYKSQAQTSYTEMVKNHLDKRINSGRDEYGTKSTPFWMATLDPMTGKYPENDERPRNIPNRVYLTRPVDAPKGSTLYWDMASLLAAYNITEMSGDSKYTDAADAYIKAFMETCVAQNGVYLWGNHFYYDAYVDSVLRFGSNGVTTPVDFEVENGSLHEMRPLPATWDILWNIDSVSVEKEIRTAGYNHISNHSTGQFNRHAQGERTGHSFLEAGGMIVHMLSWLHGKTQDEELAQKALLVANYSFSQKGEETGLLINSPRQSRWDGSTASTEVGLWARALLASSNYMGETNKNKMVTMADEAVSAWIKRGFDPSTCGYYGLLSVVDGSPVFRDGDTYPYRPDDYSNLWEPLFPRHDYPMAMAESCLELYKINNKPQYKAACERWYQNIKKELPARNGQGAYAEHYARVIHFLLHSYEVFGDSKYKALANTVAKEATDFLYLPEAKMFRSHTGENRFDTVDGVGMLSLSLIWMETGEKPEMMGFFF